jgi:outer membrane receptor protein involved in Fe transport
VLGGLALGLAARPLEAAEARYRLEIPESSYAEALIELGVQAKVSIVGVSACGEGGRVALSGPVTLEAALKTLTAGAPCSYRILDPRTVRIAAAPRAAAAPARPAVLVAELMVTASKRPVEVSRLPASVSVVSHDQIELTGSAGIADLTEQASGVLATNLGPGRDKLILRDLSDGAFTGHARSTVGSYLDDTPINYNAPDPDLPLVDVERVEIVRGPQGALYGSGSISGVYRVVTRRPDADQAAFGLAALYARTTGGAPSDEVEGYWNLPLVHDRLAVRLVGYHDVEGGYIDNAELRLSNIDRVTRDGGRLAVQFDATPTWRLDLEGAVQRLHSNDTQYTTPSTLGDTERMSHVQEGHRNDFAQLAATVRGTLPGAELRSTLAYIDHDFSSQYDASAALQDLSVNPPDLGVYDEQTRLHMVVEDTVLRSTGSGPLSWLAGVYALSTIEETPSTLSVGSGGPLSDIYMEHRRDRVREAAVYGEVDDEIARRWTLSLGGRLFTTEVRTVSTIGGLFPTVSRDFAAERRFPGFSPKLSLQRTFDDNSLVYVLFSEGSRAGGFNTGGLLFPFQPGRDHFDPDRLSNYELGLKTHLLAHRLTVHGAVFFDRWTNIQTDQYRPSGLPYTANVGDAEIEGLEAELGFDFGHGFSVQASSLLAHTRMTRTNPNFAATGVISTLAGAPDFTGGLLAIYEHPLARGLILRGVAETGYVGRSPVSFDTLRATTEGGYSNTRLSLALAARAWTATLFVANPSNAASDTFAYGNPFSFGLVRQSTPQRPRTIGLRLTANY